MVAGNLKKKTHIKLSHNMFALVMSFTIIGSVLLFLNYFTYKDLHLPVLLFLSKRYSPISFICSWWGHPPSKILKTSIPLYLIWLTQEFIENNFLKKLTKLLNSVICLLNCSHFWLKNYLKKFPSNLTNVFTSRHFSFCQKMSPELQIFLPN